MRAILPNTLPYNGGQIQLAGKGRTPGSHAYLDMRTGQCHELFYAQVETPPGPVFSLAAIADNDAIRTVRIDRGVVHGNGQLGVGDLLIVGPLEWLPAGPRATSAWRASVTTRNASRHAPAPQRPRGTIVEVAPSGTFGRIISEKGGKSLFVHQSALTGGATLRVGLRVSYVEGENGRGPLALDIRPL